MAFKLPMAGRALRQLFKRSATNLFPAPHLPRSITRYLEDAAAGKVTIIPPVATPPGFKGKIVYRKDKGCTACGLCARVCPAHAIVVNSPEKRIVIYTGHCIQCGQCVDICPRGTLALTDEFLTATEDRYGAGMILE
jgi:formate hydrogenlyase subunit 6/NADH:ubiquinone oxidoreductase subunit I